MHRGRRLRKDCCNAHFPAFKALGNVRVKYACDIIERKAAEKKSEYDFVENVITDYKIALADPEVEAVYVLTPNYAPLCRCDGRFESGKARILRKAHYGQL